MPNTNHARVDIHGNELYTLEIPMPDKITVTAMYEYIFIIIQVVPMISQEQRVSVCNVQSSTFK